MIKKTTCYYCTCNKCGHTWQPKGDYKDSKDLELRVRLCPNCKTVRWNLPQFAKKKN